jgi:hypothetical protein
MSTQSIDKIFTEAEHCNQIILQAATSIDSSSAKET